MLPVTVRSDDKIDAGGLALGAAALKSEPAGRSVDAVPGLPVGAVVFGASLAFGAGLLILLLENIVCSLDIGHGIDGFTANADFVVQMRAGGVSAASHITNSFPARDPLAFFHANF